MMKSETFWYSLLMAAIFVVLIAVADMNWPQHMGDRGALTNWIVAYGRGALMSALGIID